MALLASARRLAGERLCWPRRQEERDDGQQQPIEQPAPEPPALQHVAEQLARRQVALGEEQVAGNAPPTAAQKNQLVVKIASFFGIKPRS